MSVQTCLAVTDQHQPLLSGIAAVSRQSMAYLAFGHSALPPVSLVTLGFKGERPARFTGHYLLGNGYRAYNPVLMRFNSPDSQSPFEAGGLNVYGYCLSDPVNGVDVSGHFPTFNPVALLKGLGMGRKSTVATPPPAPSLVKSSTRYHRTVGQPLRSKTDVQYSDIKDVQVHGFDTFSFSDKGGTRFTLNAHGTHTSVVMGGKRLGGGALADKLRAEGVDFSRYTSARLNTDHAAALGRVSPAAGFAAGANAGGNPTIGHCFEKKPIPSGVIISHRISS